MRVDKNKALELRSSGKSYREIKKELGVPLATLSDWFKEIKWSQELSSKLREEAQKLHTHRIIDLNKIRGERLKKLYKEAQNEAIKDFEKLKYNPLFIAGIGIYWGEGDKGQNNSFRIANTDPKMIRVFIDFLIKVCALKKERIKCWLLLYPDLNDQKLRSFWKKELNLKDANFTKSIIIAGRHKFRRISFGVCNLSYSSRYLKEKMLTWINCLGSI